MSSYLTREQIEQILRPINPSRVSSREGLAYVEAYEVRAHMARIFGVARWSSEVVEQHMICEDAVQTRAGKPAFYVAYRSIVRVTVCAPDGTQLAVYTEGHAGDSTHPVKGEAHGNAITNSESYAFKRAACMALLDQGGLSLYGKGNKAALVKRTLVMPDNDEAISSTPVDHDAAPVAPEADTDTPPTPDASTRQVSSPPTSDQVGGTAPGEDSQDVALPDGAPVEALRARILDALQLTGQKALIELGRIGIEVSKQRLAKAQTTTPDGKPVSLEVLLDGAMKIAGRKPGGSGNAHADAAAGEAVA